MEFLNFDLETEKQAQNKTSRRKITLVAILLTGISIFFLRSNTPIPESGKVLAEQTIPMPTEINANFNSIVTDCFLPTATVYGYTLRITSAFRSLDEQEDLYEQGRTVDGHIVTDAPAGRSIHNYGYAVDVVDRWRVYDIDWEKLGRIADYCGIEQGHDGDLAHFEHRDGLSTYDFEAGKRPRLLMLPCPIMGLRSAEPKPLTLNDLRACGAPDFNRE